MTATRQFLGRYGLCPTNLAFIALIVVLGVTALSQSPSASGRKAPFVAKLSAPGHHPKANKPWPITITAKTYSGKKLSGRVQYEFVFNGQVVSRQSNYRFKNGIFRDTITWPKRSVGINLVFRPVITTRRGVVRISYGVKVRR